MSEVERLKSEVDRLTHLLECAESEKAALEFQAECDHPNWGHNAGYDVCLVCSYRRENDEAIS